MEGCLDTLEVPLGQKFWATLRATSHVIPIVALTASAADITSDRGEVERMLARLRHSGSAALLAALAG